MTPTQFTASSLIVAELTKAAKTTTYNPGNIPINTPDEKPDGGMHLKIEGNPLTALLPLLLAGGVGGAVGVANEDEEDLRRGRGAAKRFLRGSLMGSAGLMGAGAGAGLGSFAGALAGNATAGPNGVGAGALLGAGGGAAGGVVGGAALMRSLIGK